MISSTAAGPGCIIQGSYVSTPYKPEGQRQNFEVITFETQPGNKNLKQLKHYWRDNTNTKQPWNGDTGIIISTKATGPGTLIQTNFNTPQGPGNLAVLVPEGSNLVLYYRDPWTASKAPQWREAGVVSNVLHS